MPQGRAFSVVEDAKGMRTREYQIKRKLMKAIHGIEIREHRRAKNGGVK